MPNVQRMTRKTLGEVLIQAGMIDDLQLQAAMADLKDGRQTLGEALVRREFAAERDIAQALVTQFSLPYLSASQITVPGQVASLLPLDLMRRHLLAPIDRFGNCLTILAADVLNAEVLAQIESHTGCEVQVFVGTAEDVRELIARIETEPEPDANDADQAEPSLTQELLEALPEE